MKVAGQTAGIVLYDLDLDVEGAFVTLRVEGSGDGYATLTPDQALELAGELQRKADVARRNSGLTAGAS